VYEDLGVFVLWIVTTCASNPTAGPTANPDTPTPLNGTVVGTIQDSSGQPIPDMNVSLQAASSLQNLFEPALQVQGNANGKTNAEGQFSLEVSEEGEYNLTALKGGVGLFLKIKIEKQNNAIVKLDLKVLTAKELGSIQGRAKRPVGDAHGNILVAAEGSSFVATTTPAGDFLMSNLPEGSYTLRASDQEGKLGGFRACYRGCEERRSYYARDPITLNHAQSKNQ
jgi:hypothetical protein